MPELWTPTQTHERRVKPTERKAEGGSIFDDELETERSQFEKVQQERARLIDHINQRPDHTIHVGSAEEREKMRVVFNDWHQRKLINHHPNIRIDYGVPDGNMRISE